MDQYKNDKYRVEAHGLSSNQWKREIKHKTKFKSLNINSLRIVYNKNINFLVPQREHLELTKESTTA